MGNDFYSLVNFFEHMFEDPDFFIRPLNFHLDIVTYPPVDVIVKDNKDLEFEFALAGYAVEDVHVDFSGDHMRVSGKRPEKKEELKYLHKGIKRGEFKSCYYVPADKYATADTKAQWKDGILSVFVPSKENKESRKIVINKV